MKVLHAYGGREFISAKLKNIYNQKGITINYTALYMYNENGLANQLFMNS